MEFLRFQIRPHRTGPYQCQEGEEEEARNSEKNPKKVREKQLVQLNVRKEEKKNQERRRIFFSSQGKKRDGRTLIN